MRVTRIVRHKGSGGVILAAKPEDRAMLYRVASETGCRAAELASLSMSSLDLSASVPSINLAATNSKRRQTDVQPIRCELAVQLEEWLKVRHGPD